MAEQWAVEVDVKKMLHSSSSGQAYYFIFIVFVFLWVIIYKVILFKKYFLDGGQHPAPMENVQKSING